MNTIQERHHVTNKTGSRDEDTQLHSRKRTSRTIDKKVGRHALLRRIYFASASLWGFMLGMGFLAVALSAGGSEVPKDLKTLGMVAGGTVLSIIGGLVAAKAYREAMGR